MSRAIIAGHQVDETVAKQAGIPVVGVTDGTSTVSFETSGAPALFAGMAVALYKQGCRKLGFVATEGAEIYQTQVSKAEPWKSVTTSYLPINAPDVTAPIANDEERWRAVHRRGESARANHSGRHCGAPSRP